MSERTELRQATERRRKELKRPGFAVGIAYAGQEVAALPAREQRLDAVLTENGLRRFGAPPDRP